MLYILIFNRELLLKINYESYVNVINIIACVLEKFCIFISK